MSGGGTAGPHGATSRRAWRQRRAAPVRSRRRLPRVPSAGAARPPGSPRPGQRMAPRRDVAALRPPRPSGLRDPVRRSVPRRPLSRALCPRGRRPLSIGRRCRRPPPFGWGRDLRRGGSFGRPAGRSPRFSVGSFRARGAASSRKPRVGSFSRARRPFGAQAVRSCRCPSSTRGRSRSPATGSVSSISRPTSSPGRSAGRARSMRSCPARPGAPYGWRR